MNTTEKIYPRSDPKISMHTDLVSRFKLMEELSLLLSGFEVSINLFIMSDQHMLPFSSCLWITKHGRAIDQYG